MDAEPERTLQAAGLSLHLGERVLTVTKTTDSLRIAAFSGPVGAALGRDELSKLAAQKPQLVLMLGGLGDTPSQAEASVRGLAGLELPVIFVPGGADRGSVIEDALSTLDEHGRSFLFNGAALRELRIGQDRIAVVPGAALGRYAVDEEACGFNADDLDTLAESFDDRTPSQRLWLLAWNAPSGEGLTTGFGDREVGSEELAELARTLGTQGGIYAFPESAAGNAPLPKRFAFVAPRLGRTGATHAHGGRVPSSLANIVWSAAGPRLD